MTDEMEQAHQARAHTHAHTHTRAGGDEYYGGGFDERIEVAGETLGRIDGAWACYRCIGEELVHACADGERFVEALDTIDDLRAEVRRHQPWKAEGVFGHGRARALAGLGRFDEALTEIEAWPDRERGPGVRQSVLGFEAFLLTRMGRFDEALERGRNPGWTANQYEERRLNKKFQFMYDYQSGLLKQLFSGKLNILNDCRIV